MKMLESSFGDHPACILYCVTRFINVKDLSGFEMIKVSLLFYRPSHFESIVNDGIDARGVRFCFELTVQRLLVIVE